MKALSTKVLISVLVVVLVISSVSPTYANSKNADESIVEQEQRAIEVLKKHGYTDNEIQDTIKKVETIAEYFVRDGADLSFDADRALEDGVDKKLVSIVKSDIERMKEYEEKQSTSKALELENRNVEVAAEDCPGVNASYPSQYVILTDNCVSRQLELALQTGGALYTIAGILLSAITGIAGVATAIAGVIMGYTAWYLGYMNQGRGLWIFYERPEIISQ